MAKGNNARKKEIKKPKKGAKQKGIKGNGYSKVNAGRTYPGIVGLPQPDLPGTTRGVDM